MTKNIPLLGAHVSIAGGFYKAIEEGINLQCTAIQIFTKSSRQWQAKPITEESIQLFLHHQKKSDIKVVTAHASYLINLGSKNKITQQKSCNALIDEIKRCNALQIPFLVLHPGTKDPESPKESLQHIGKLIQKSLLATPECKTSILIETMAGQGNSAGKTFEELAIILQQVTKKSRIGICFDTCHAFAAGYDFSTKIKFKTVMDDFDKTIGLKYLKMFHINDSKKELGSCKDRHEHIGMGQISLKSFQMIMQDPRFTHVPKIIETPKDDDGSDRTNLEKLKSLL